jgi:hypothetical protein
MQTMVGLWKWICDISFGYPVFVSLKKKHQLNFKNMYRQILVPTEKDHTIILPESLFGKQVEVLVKELLEKEVRPLPDTLKDKKFWEEIDYDPDFPSIHEIRSSAWPARTW